MNPSITLRDYQQSACDAVMAGYQRGLGRLIVVAPMGSGKTIIFSYIIEQVIGETGRALVLAHTEELIEQAVRSVREMLPGVSVGVIRAEEDEPDTRIVVGSVQTLRNPERLARAGVFDFIVIDEAHHAAADSYRLILDRLGALDDTPSGPLVLGVTATPARGDGQSLDDIFEEISYSIDILSLIGQGHLVNVRAKQITLDLDLDQVDRRGGDFADGSLGEAMDKAHAPEHIAEAIRQYASNRKCVVFCATVALAQQTAASLNAIGIRAESVDGTTPKEERRRIIAAIRSGELQVVTNCQVLTEGFDAPVLDCAVYARPTSSATLYQQSVGRVLRTWMNKPDALILDVVGVTSKHSLQSAASLFGDALAGGEILDGETATQAIHRHQLEQVARSGGRLVAVDVEVFDRSALNWTESPGGLMVLTGIKRPFAIVPTGDDGCDLYVLSKNPEGYGLIAKPMVRNTSIELAMGRAEDNIKIAGLDPGSNRNAAWRQDSVSNPQRSKLWMLGFRDRKKLAALTTKGEAANLITALEADAALAPFLGAVAA